MLEPRRTRGRARHDRDRMCKGWFPGQELVRVQVQKARQERQRADSKELVYVMKSTGQKMPG